MIQFNPQQAADADSGGNGNFNSQVADCVIKEAKFVTANSGTQGVEFTLMSREGQEFKYLALYYQKADGTQLTIGGNMIQAIMGVTGVQQLSNQNGNIPELTGKHGKFALERENRIKNDGKEGFSFTIRSVMNMQTGQTYGEAQQSKPADNLAYWTKRFEENPNGVQAKQSNASQSRPVQQGVSAGAPPAGHDFDDTIPF